MFYGDEVTLLGRGPQVPPKLLQTIGILNRSVCWGILVPDLRGTSEKPPHLLVAPMHPDSWPFLFRLRVSLQHGVGSMHRLSTVLSANEANILFVEGGPAGHHHASINIIAEALQVKDELLPEKKAGIDPLPLCGLDLDDRFEFCNRLATSMFKFIRDLKRDIIEEHMAAGGRAYDEELRRDDQIRSRLQARGRQEISFAGLIPLDLVRDVGFLHHRMAKNWQLFYDPAGLAKGVEKEVYANRIGALSCRWLENLAFFSVYGSGIARPMRFEYDEATTILSVAKGSTGAYLKSIKPFDPPTIALAIFDNVENYLRLHPLRREDARTSLDRIKVTYRAEFEQDRRSSRGIMATVCNEIKSRKVNLLRVTQTMNSLDETGETGIITFVGETLCTDEATAERRRSSLREGIIGLHETPFSKSADFRVLEVEVGPCRIKRIFVSLPFDKVGEFVQYEKKVVEIVERAAEMEGWVPVIVKTHTDDLGPEIEGRIRECEAFLQVAFLRKDQDPAAADFAFLNYEYGVARGAQKPAIRLVETSKKDLQYWKRKLRVDPGKDLRDFDLNGENVDSEFCSALRELEVRARRSQKAD